MTRDAKVATARVLDYILARFDKREIPRENLAHNLLNPVEQLPHGQESLIAIKFRMLMGHTRLNKFRLIAALEHLKESGVISTMDISCLKEVDKGWNERTKLLATGIPDVEDIRIETDRERIYSSLATLKEELKIRQQSEAQPISSLICVKPNESQNTYKLILNNDYANTLNADRAKPSWDLLFKVADGDSIRSNQHKASLDYLNTNDSCKLYSQTGHTLTKILKSEDGYIVPAIMINVITEKAYQQRLKKGRQAA